MSEIWGEIKRNKKSVEKEDEAVASDDMDNKKTRK
jgi:hypothetical protein